MKAPSYDQLANDLKQALKKSQIESNPALNGKQLYEDLDDIRRAGLLNIHTKMEATVFDNGRNVFSYVSSLTRVRGDRFFARVDKDLRDENKNSFAHRLFNEAPGGLHTPPPGFSSAGSFKTYESYGNLQLTFFSKPETLEFIVDADIDDAQGIGHVFQVLGHLFTRGQTHPYDIHQILIHHQKIDPGYQLTA